MRSFFILVLALCHLEVFALPPINGVLGTNGVNPRYFTNNSGPVFLAGSHCWNNLMTFSEYGPWTNALYLHLLTTNNMNHIRLWGIENHWMPFPTILGGQVTPPIYQRTGPGNAADGGLKYDLTLLNQTYFDTLRNRCTNAANSNIYVSVMLFEGWWVVGHPGGYTNTPYAAGNNIQASGASENDTYRLGANATTLAAQERYVIKAIDTLNDLDNVLWEIMNEAPTNTAAWQWHMINLIKTNEATRAKQHLVGISCVPWSNPNIQLTLNPPSGADYVCPSLIDTGIDWTNDPVTYATNIFLMDTDHNSTGKNFHDPQWPWKAMTRGSAGVIAMDRLAILGSFPPSLSPDNAQQPQFRRALGQAKAFADRTPLLSMMPSNTLANSKYCLAHTAGDHYLVYQNTNGANIVVTPAVAQGFEFEWFNPTTTGLGTRTGITNLPASASTFTPPESHTADSLLYLRKITPKTPVWGL